MNKNTLISLRSYWERYLPNLVSLYPLSVTKMMSTAFAVSPIAIRATNFLPSTIKRRPRTPVTVRRQVSATIQPDPTTQPKQTSAPKPQSNGTPPPTPPQSEASQSIQKDLLATLAWITVAVATAGAIFTTSPQHSLEFLTAYIVEYSLSVDNLFVFLLVFEYFRVPRESQARVLTYGIVGAMLMRGAFIVAGEALTHRFKAVTIGFAALLLFSAGKLLFGEEEEEDLENNSIIKFSRRLMNFSDRYDGDRFFTHINGAKLATPMLLVLFCIELSDIVFALDSVPAVLGISDDTLVIYLSNILAIVGLRNLYFVLSDAIGDLRFLRQSLAVVLGFVGGKMLAGVAGFKIGTVESLLIVVGTLVAGVGLSVWFPAEKEEVVER